LKLVLAVYSYVLLNKTKVYLQNEYVKLTQLPKRLRMLLEQLMS